jgi:hypothetical protein
MIEGKNREKSLNNFPGYINLLKFGEKEMKKMMMILTIALVAAFFSAMIAPTFAAKPTTIDNAWFVIPMFVNHPTATSISINPDKVWTSDDGTVLHSRNTQITTYIAHTPSNLASGTVRWGYMTAVSNFVFDTKTSTGTYTMKITLDLTDSFGTNGAGNPNTYGIGTLEGTLVAEITSLNPYVNPTLNCPMPGNGQGHFIATHGTGAFENAKLSADVTLETQDLVVGGAHIGIEYLFIGHHANHLYNDGTLTFHQSGPSQ